MQMFKDTMLGLCLVLLIVSCSAGAFDGALDASFGTGGLVTCNMQNPATADASYALVVRHDGVIVAGGSSATPHGLSGQGFALAILSSSGSIICKSFLNPLATGSFDQINGLAVQPDNKVIAVGVSNAGGGIFTVARYNTDCTLDTTFGTNGITQITFPGATDARAYAVALTADGSIVVVGEAGQLMGDLFYAVAVLNQDGTLNSNFASGAGRRIYDNLVSNESSSARAVAIQLLGNQENFIIAGYGNQSGTLQFQVLRIMSNGDVDNTFGSNLNGVEQINFNAGDNEISHGVAVRPNGTIVAVGTSMATGIIQQIVAAQLLSNGTLDASFGVGGKITFQPSMQQYAAANGIVVQNDQKIVVAGTTTNSITSLIDVLVARFDTHGALDTALFNPGEGFVITDFADNSQAFAIALQCDGKIVISGINAADPQQFALARYVDENGNQEVIVDPTITQPINLSNSPTPQPTLSGAAQNPANITIYIDGVEVTRTVTQGAANSWTFTPPIPLSNGKHTVQVVAQYKSGNQNCITDPVCFGVCLGEQSCISQAIRPKYCPSCNNLPPV